MKIAVAQFRPLAGDIERNIDGHGALIRLAVAHDANLVVFPELSITGYEPVLAEELARTPDDSCFDVFQQLSNAHQITIAAGAPIRCVDGTCISLLVFRPGRDRIVYSKQYLHPDEEPFFVSGGKSDVLIGGTGVALAICYELSVSEHVAQAVGQGADVYLASVAKTSQGVRAACTRLANIARENSMVVLMSNCVSESGALVCAGGSAVWNRNGILLEQLDDNSQGVIVVDTQSGRSRSSTLDKNYQLPVN